MKNSEVKNEHKNKDGKPNFFFLVFQAQDILRCNINETKI